MLRQASQTKFCPAFRTEAAQPMRWPIWSWAMAAAVVVAAVLGARVEQRHEQRIAGEHARQQVLLALRITNSTLQAVDHKISEDRTTRKVEP